MKLDVCRAEGEGGGESFNVPEIITVHSSPKSFRIVRSCDFAGCCSCSKRLELSHKLCMANPVLKPGSPKPPAFRILYGYLWFNCGMSSLLRLRSAA